MDYAPLVRICLRYLIGAVIAGSQVIGDDLAADPDLVSVLALAIGAIVEFVYYRAKKHGGAT